MAPGGDPTTLLTDETKRETNAQLMTPDEARKVGFAGIEDDPTHDKRLIAVHARDSRWITRALEANNTVASFKIHEVDD